MIEKHKFVWDMLWFEQPLASDAHDLDINAWIEQNQLICAVTIREWQGYFYLCYSPQVSSSCITF